jgi:hypothetical protein
MGVTGMNARVNERKTEYLVEQTRFPHPHVADDDIFKDELEHVGKRSIGRGCYK